MADIPFNIAECTVTFNAAGYGYTSRYHHFYGVAQHPKHGEIAKIRGLKVERRYTFKDNSDFLEMMDEESQEMMEFATMLFDARSIIRPWLIDGGYRSGSGCWGTELSVGEIVYIEDLTVKEQVGLLTIGFFLARVMRCKSVPQTWGRIVGPTTIFPIIDGAMGFKRLLLAHTFQRRVRYQD
jgi:hypothetical protein